MNIKNLKELSEYSLGQLVPVFENVKKELANNVPLDYVSIYHRQYVDDELICRFGNKVEAETNLPTDGVVRVWFKVKDIRNFLADLIPMRNSKAHIATAVPWNMVFKSSEKVTLTSVCFNYQDKVFTHEYLDPIEFVNGTAKVTVGDFDIVILLSRVLPDKGKYQHSMRIYSISAPRSDERDFNIRLTEFSVRNDENGYNLCNDVIETIRDCCNKPLTDVKAIEIKIYNMDSSTYETYSISETATKSIDTFDEAFNDIYDFRDPIEIEGYIWFNDGSYVASGGCVQERPQCWTYVKTPVIPAYLTK